MMDEKTEQTETTQPPQAEEVEKTFAQVFEEGALVSVEGFLLKIIKRDGKEITLRLVPVKRTQPRKRK